jgi:hypothetical protein
MPFSEAVQVIGVVDETPSANDTLVNIISSGTFTSSNQLYLTFFYRTTLANTNETASLRTRWHEDVSGGYIEPSFNLTPTMEWQQSITVVDSADFGASDYNVRLNLGLGDNSQTLEIGGVQVTTAPLDSSSPGQFAAPAAFQYPQQVPMLSTNLIPVLTNDIGITNDILRITTLLTLPEHGTATIDASGTNVIYTSTEEFFGVEEFVYAMSDQYGNCSSANIKIWYGTTSTTARGMWAMTLRDIPPLRVCANNILRRPMNTIRPMPTLEWGGQPVLTMRPPWTAILMRTPISII